MAWKECRVEESRLEFVRLALVEDANIKALCHRFGVSRKTGYKWLKRAKLAEGDVLAALSDRSRRPLSSPGQMTAAAEKRVVQLRRRHRSWGGRKIADVLKRGGQALLSPSAVTRALHRHGLIEPAASESRKPPVRFERETPNDLWQMDFKGHFALGDGSRCHPLTVLDDHSRFSIVLAACADERTETVRGHLIDAFKRYGLPRQLLTDNGSPWGTSGYRIEDQWTVLSVWLLRLGIGVIHGRPGHPQTQGKEERFHRTLVDDLLRWKTLGDLAAAGRSFKTYRQTYNFVRPHEALPDRVSPGSRYVVSPRSYPRQLPDLRYDNAAAICQVSRNGRLSFRGRLFAMGKPFVGQPLALRPTLRQGLWEVFYCHTRVGWLDEASGETMGPRNTGPLAEIVKMQYQNNGE